MRLLAIVEVGKQQRVYCQAPECTRSVYKEIHVIEDEGEILTPGSTCYKLLFGHERTRKPVFTSEKSRILTDAERALLLQNTQVLIDQFKKEQLVQEAKEKLLAPGNNNHKVAQPGLSPDSLRMVECSFCNSPMETVLLTKPARGYRCDSCKASGLSDRHLKQSYSRANR